MGCCGQWGKSAAYRWLVKLLLLAFIIGFVSVFCASVAIVGQRAQSQGSCSEPNKTYHSLGKWDDTKDELHLNWHVCERTSNQSNNTGWAQFQDSWYKAVCGWRDYEGAVLSCKEQDSLLVSIHSAAENMFVQQLCGFETCWIGLSEQPNSEKWVWEDGTPLASKGSYRNWNPGEPNNWKGRDENVAIMNLWSRLDMAYPGEDADNCGAPPRRVPWGSGKWFDIAKDFRVQYSICEKPLEASACKGWKVFDGSCYYRHCALLDFWEAERACDAQGAKLVKIESPEENLVVRELCGVHTCRIGLSEPPGTEMWTWPDGTRLGEKYDWRGYQNWNDGEPNNWGGYDEDAAVMNSNELVKSIRKAFLFRRLKPLYNMWMCAEIGLPLALLAGVCLAFRWHVSCFAQAVCIVSGVASVCIAFQIAVSLVTFGKVDDSWPAGSKGVIGGICCLALLQMMICCTATAKAQELQWSTTIAWNSMGAREVGADLNATDAGSLSAELREMPTETTQRE